MFPDFSWYRPKAPTVDDPHKLRRLTWRSYVWHYFSAVFCPWTPSEWRFGWRTTGGTVPRCNECAASWGMCHHTGGPYLATCATLGCDKPYGQCEHSRVPQALLQ